MGEIGEKTMCKRGFQKASSVPWSRCALVVSFISNNHILQCIGKVDFHMFPTMESFLCHGWEEWDLISLQLEWLPQS